MPSGPQLPFTSWAEVPKFVVVGVPIQGRSAEKWPVWADLDGKNVDTASIRITWRRDFASTTVSVNTAEAIRRRILGTVSAKGEASDFWRYEWKVRVRPGVRRIIGE